MKKGDEAIISYLKYRPISKHLLSHDLCSKVIIRRKKNKKSWSSVLLKLASTTVRTGAPAPVWRPHRIAAFFHRLLTGVSAESIWRRWGGGVSASTATTALLPMILSSQALEAELKCRQGRATPGRARSSAQTPG